MMGVVKNSNPMQTTVDLLYTVSGCSAKNCKMISHQSISFHSKDKKAIEKGTYDNPLKLLDGSQVWSHNPHHYFRWYPSNSCGISTDRTTGDNCWNNMFATHRWENIPGGNDKSKHGQDKHRCDQHGTFNPTNCAKAGDANMLWVRPKKDLHAKASLRKDAAYCNDSSDNSWALALGLKKYAENFYGTIKSGGKPSYPDIGVCADQCAKLAGCNYFVTFSGVYGGGALCQFAKKCGTMKDYSDNRHKVYSMK